MMLEIDRESFLIRKAESGTLEKSGKKVLTKVSGIKIPTWVSNFRGLKAESEISDRMNFYTSKP